MVVDAGSNLSESGADDLAAARGMFRSASYPESNGGLLSAAGLLKNINVRAIRVINDENGSYLDQAGNFVASARLGWDLPWVKQYGYSPHVVVGQRCPTNFPCPAGYWDSATWAAYQDYAYKFVRWVVTQFDGAGFLETMFEVGNEVDITPDVNDLWTMVNPSVAQGDEGRYQHYMRIYPVWAKAVARVAAENPGRTVRIAGPAMGAQSLYLNGSLYHARFVREVVAAGLRLDVLTAHFYADVVNGWQGVANSSLRGQLLLMREALNSNGRGNTPIYVSEYGPGPGSDSVGGYINYSHQGAPWGVLFAIEAAAGTASGGSILNVRDNFGANTTGVPGVASFNDIQNGVEYPKAIYNAFRMVDMLPGSRKAVTLQSQQPDVRGLAAASSTNAALIATNYNYHFIWPSDWQDHTTNQTVVPGFRNLPFTGSVGVERYLIDRDTSNVGKFIDAGQPPDATASTLTRVEACAATVDGTGALVLPARVLAPSAVSMWVLTSGGGSGLSACPQ